MPYAIKCLRYVAKKKKKKKKKKDNLSHVFLRLSMYDVLIQLGDVRWSVLVESQIGIDI